MKARYPLEREGRNDKGEVVETAVTRSNSASAAVRPEESKSRMIAVQRSRGVGMAPESPGGGRQGSRGLWSGHFAIAATTRGEESIVTIPEFSQGLDR